MQAILLCWTAAATAGAAVGGPVDEVTVAWRGEEVAPADLPAEELGESPRATAEAWAPFAAARGYELHLTDDGRVLYVAPERRSPAKKDLRLVADTLERFDALLPPPPAAPVTPQDGGAPEDGRAGRTQGEDGGWSTSWSWGAGAWRRDAETAVLVAAQDADDYGAALDALADRHEHLRAWAPTARGTAGCTLESPLVTIWLRAGAGLEEYRPENELVHRLTTLLVHRRFGHQPAWMLRGLAWHVEEELLGSLYCFPGRDDFVLATEHTGWDKALKSAHRRTDELALAELIALDRGRFDPGAARNAFGVVRFLVEHHGEAVPALLDALRRLREERGVLHAPDGTWTRIPGYEPAPEDVLPLLQAAAGPDVLAELLESFRKGKRYEPR